MALSRVAERILYAQHRYNLTFLTKLRAGSVNYKTALNTVTALELQPTGEQNNGCWELLSFCHPVLFWFTLMIYWNQPYKQLPLLFTSKDLQLCTWNWSFALLLPQTTAYHSAKAKRLSNNFTWNHRCLLLRKSIRFLLHPGIEQEEHQRYWSTKT